MASYGTGEKIEARAYLKQAFMIDSLIRARLSRIEDLRGLRAAVGGFTAGERVASTPRVDRMAELTVQILDLENECARDIERLLALKSEIDTLVSRVGNPLYQLILTERYINLKTWARIAEDNNYTVDAVHRIHRKALQIIKRLLFSTILT